MKISSGIGLWWCALHSTEAAGRMLPRAHVRGELGLGFPRSCAEQNYPGGFCFSLSCRSGVIRGLLRAGSGMNMLVGKNG